MGNTEKAIAFAAQKMKELFPNTRNAEQITEDLKKLNPKEFDALMHKLKSGEEYLPATLPNLNGQHMPKDHILAVAKKWGIDPFQHMLMTDPDVEGKEFVTPLRYMTLLLPLPRFSQTLESKISLPKDQNHVDEMTGQVTGDSKGARVSFNEMNILAGKEMIAPIIETMKVRGGDEGARKQFEHDVILNGVGNLEDAVKSGTGVKSTMTLAAKLRSIHINTTVDK